MTQIFIDERLSVRLMIALATASIDVIFKDNEAHVMKKEMLTVAHKGVFDKFHMEKAEKKRTRKRLRNLRQ